MHAPEFFGMKGNSAYIKSMAINPLSNHKVRDFAMAFRVRKLFGSFEKQVPGLINASKEHN